MLNDIASNTSFFGIFITGVAYVLACAIQKRFKSSILNPLLVSCVILIIFMLVSGIDYNVYLYGKPKADGTYDGTGAIFFQNMLTPLLTEERAALMAKLTEYYDALQAYNASALVPVELSESVV